MLVVVAACAAGVVHLRAAGGPGNGAKLLALFELAPISLTNFGYTQSELDTAAGNGLIVDDQPAIGSGLISMGGNEYLGITDRGPNVDHFPDTTVPCDSGSANGKTHPLPQFTPAIVRFRANGGAIELLNIVNLVTSNGITGITGLSNLPGGGENDDPSFFSPCATTGSFNVNGMDVEDFALLPNGKFLGVEENRPSLFVGDLATGVIETRYIPSNKALTGANYLVSATLPAVLAKRRGNRGFEGVAISPDQQTVYTMTQSPLEVGCTPPNSTAPCRNSRVLRILKLDVSNPNAIAVTGQDIYRMSDPGVYPQPTSGGNLKLSAMAWVGPTKLLLLQLSDEPGKGGVQLVLVDLEGATDINLTYDNSLVPEQTAGSGFTHVSRQVVFEEFVTNPQPNVSSGPTSWKACPSATPTSSTSSTTTTSASQSRSTRRPISEGQVGRPAPPRKVVVRPTRAGRVGNDPACPQFVPFFHSSFCRRSAAVDPCSPRPDNRRHDEVLVAIWSHRAACCFPCRPADR